MYYCSEHAFKDDKYIISKGRDCQNITYCFDEYRSSPFNILSNNYFPVHNPFRCTFEAAGKCALEQSKDSDDEWRLIKAGVDTSFGGFDHTTLSGTEIS